jgi:hypothetical protein
MVEVPELRTDYDTSALLLSEHQTAARTFFLSCPGLHVYAMMQAKPYRVSRSATRVWPMTYLGRPGEYTEYRV